MCLRKILFVIFCYTYVIKTPGRHSIKVRRRTKELEDTKVTSLSQIPSDSQIPTGLHSSTVNKRKKKKAVFLEMSITT